MRRWKKPVGPLNGYAGAGRGLTDTGDKALFVFPNGNTPS